MTLWVSKTIEINEIIITTIVIQCDCCKVRLAEYRYTRMEVCVYCQQHLSPKELGPKNWQFEITQFASDGLINLVSNNSFSNIHVRTHTCIKIFIGTKRNTLLYHVRVL